MKASAREWLRANGYGDVADMIDEILAEWTVRRKRAAPELVAGPRGPKGR